MAPRQKYTAEHRLTITNSSSRPKTRSKMICMSTMDEKCNDKKAVLSQRDRSMPQYNSKICGSWALKDAMHNDRSQIINAAVFK